MSLDRPSDVDNPSEKGDIKSVLVMISLAALIAAGYIKYALWQNEPKDAAIVTCLNKCNNDAGDSCSFGDLFSHADNEVIRKKLGVAECARRVLAENIETGLSKGDMDSRLKHPSIMHLTILDVDRVGNSEEIDINW